MNKKIIAFLLIGMSIPVLADYVQTTFYFAVPSSTTFTVAYLDGGTNTSEGSFPPAIVGGTYFFNSTTGYSVLVQPCVNGQTYSTADLRCQVGVARPAMVLTNTGTVNIDFWARWGTALPTGVLTCANGSKRDNTGTQTVKSTCTMGELNTTIAMMFATAVAPAAPSNAVNFTIYANFSNVAGGTNARTLYTNNTAT
jgi:hypothetical protein